MRWTMSFDELTQAELELVEGIRPTQFDHLLVSGRFLPDLLEEKTILVSEVRAEALVEQVDDF
jgi:hypothetical protein